MVPRTVYFTSLLILLGQVTCVSGQGPNRYRGYRSTVYAPDYSCFDAARSYTNSGQLPVIGSSTERVSGDALLSVEVPMDSRVFVNGQQSARSGRMRTFRIPGKKGDQADFEVRVELDRASGLWQATKTRVVAGGSRGTLVFQLSDLQPVSAAPKAAPRVLQPIVETAQAAGKFMELLKAAKASGLLEEVFGAGPYTIFAPTDAAFHDLGKEKLQQLMREENRSDLRKVLEYHAVIGKLTAAQCAEKGSLQTVLRGATLKAVGEPLRVNDAHVIQADLECTNGMLHAIDRVLLPPDFEILKRRTSNNHSSRSF